jgi:alkylation response protein AidB-like acyl-CoA dehydrogenase
MVGGIGMTEPDTGSSIKDISTQAVRDGDEYVIDGEKKWVGNGTVADWIVTLCRTDTNQTDTREGLSFIIVPTEQAGFSAEPMEKLGLDAADHGRLNYDGVRVPTENLIGEEEGRGFYQAIDWLNHGRVTTAATALGMAQGAFDRALEYAKHREQGGQVIGNYQGMRWKFVDMYQKISVARSQTYRAAHSVEENSPSLPGANPISEASIAKLYASEMAQEVTREAIQVFGGDGYAKEYEVEHFYRDVRSTTLYEGTSEILRNTIGKVLFDELG